MLLRESIFITIKRSREHYDERELKGMCAHKSKSSVLLKKNLITRVFHMKEL